LISALEVGAYIEELDIADLRDRTASTDVDALDETYARLERGSRNHLRAFASQLDARGVDYVAEVLADADAIIAAPMERGHD
jgi:hypothetical protein